MLVERRSRHLRGLFAKAGVDALLVTNLTNIRYLTGFTGSAASLLVTVEKMLAVTDGRYRAQIAEQSQAADVTLEVFVGNPVEQDEQLLRVAPDRTGLEASSVSWARQRRLAERHPVELVATDGLVEGLRRVKDDGELDRLRRAAQIADDALARMLPRLTDGPTETEFALALDFEMRRGGADGPSFDTIVASGPNGARPHARPSHRRIEKGDLVVIDFGALVDGYHSDMTRTVSVGEPSEEARRMYEVVSLAQAAGVDVVRAGVEAKAVDDACRRVISDAGWADAFVHGTGHGVGLDIHEAPAVSSTSADSLAAGHVVTVEPGVYLPHIGGVRIEDTVVVTDEGQLTLTNAPKDLRIA